MPEPDWFSVNGIMDGSTFTPLVNSECTDLQVRLNASSTDEPNEMNPPEGNYEVSEHATNSMYIR